MDLPTTFKFARKMNSHEVLQDPNVAPVHHPDPGPYTSTAVSKYLRDVPFSRTIPFLRTIAERTSGSKHNRP